MWTIVRDLANRVRFPVVRLLFSWTARYTDLPVVLVFTMGKVGSSTIYHALRRSRLCFGVIHLHFISRENTSKAIARHLDAGWKTPPPHLAASPLVRDIVSRLHSDRVHVITLVRDPIAFAISNVFQNPYFHPGVSLGEKGSSFNEITRYLLENVLVPDSDSFKYWRNWFADEIESTFNVRLVDHPFDKSSGWTMVQGDRGKILILQLESLDRAFSVASTELFGRDLGFDLRQRNSRSRVDRVYEKVIENIRLPRNDVKRIYSDSLMRYFYSDSDIERFTRKWSALAD